MCIICTLVGLEHYTGCIWCALIRIMVLLLFHYLTPGSAVLVLTTTDVDKTGASYYGEQGLHYLSARGDGNMVPLGRHVWILLTYTVNDIRLLLCVCMLGRYM